VSDAAADARPAIGFVGLGVMGLPMAQNLLRAGYPVTATTRTRARAESLFDGGATWAESPAAVATASAVVVTMLPDSPDVVDVARGDDGLLAGAHAGLTWIDMSSIAPGVTTMLAGEADARGVASLDAPVSGGEQGAIDGTLSIMVGGPAHVFEQCLPILEVLGGSVVRVGEHGAGQVTKLCNQMVVGTTISIVAEALVLAAKSGVDPAAVRQVLLGGFAQSRILDVHGQRMLDGDFRPGFRSVLHQKDLANALDAARGTASPSPLTAEVMQLLTALQAAEGGDLDHSALFTVYEGLAGMERDGDA
jgi:2-hydroxy-3-oxopropionate reductase